MVPPIDRPERFLQDTNDEKSSVAVVNRDVSAFVARVEATSVIQSLVEALQAPDDFNCLPNEGTSIIELL